MFDAEFGGSTALAAVASNPLAGAPEPRAAGSAPRSRREQFVQGTRSLLLALGGGTGLFVEEAAPPVLRWDMENRMRCQNNALAVLMVVVYVAALFMALSFLRWKVENESPITYYSDPRNGTEALEGHDLIGFLSTFNQAPKQVRLQVTGLLPVDEHLSTMQFEGDFYRVSFSFALDLTPWLVREDWQPGSGEPDGAQGPLLGGVGHEELAQLREFLASDRNDLAHVELRKEVAWPDWEDVATNIKQRIRQQGFNGALDVRCTTSEVITVHKNRPWANFLHNRSTRIIAALSVFGLAVHSLYMLLRVTKLTIHARYRVTVPAKDYWELVSHRINATGFDDMDAELAAEADLLQPGTGGA